MVAKKRKKNTPRHSSRNIRVQSSAGDKSPIIQAGVVFIIVAAMLLLMFVARNY